MRISQGVMDPVTATALVLDSGDEQVIFVSCDLVTIYDRLLNGIREKVQAERPDIPVMKIILNATHTHCGPSCEDDIKPFGFAMEVASSLEHSEFVIAQCADAIKDFTYEGTPEEQMRANSMLVSLRNRYKAIIDRYEEQKEQPKHPMEMHVIGLGDIAFATNQFELYMDYQHRIQARSPFEQTFIVQLAGQSGRRSGTYLATERGAQGRGYSASMFCNRVSPEGGQELVEETVKILKEIHE